MPTLAAFLGGLGWGFDLVIDLFAVRLFRFWPSAIIRHRAGRGCHPAAATGDGRGRKSQRGRQRKAPACRGSTTSSSASVGFAAIPRRRGGRIAVCPLGGIRIRLLLPGSGGAGRGLGVGNRNRQRLLARTKMSDGMPRRDYPMLQAGLEAVPDCFTHCLAVGTERRRLGLDGAVAIDGAPRPECGFAFIAFDEVPTDGHPTARKNYLGIVHRLRYFARSR